MKVKKFHKKLVLNKETIAHLRNSEQDAVKGGETWACLSRRVCPETDQACATSPPWPTCPLTGEPVCAECE